MTTEIVVTSSLTSPERRSALGCSASNSKYIGSRYPIRYPMLSRQTRSGNKKTVMASGFRSGETRTRTGDTTIFSRAPLALEFHGFAGDSGDCCRLAPVNVFPDFASVLRTLRPTKALVGLLAGDSLDAIRKPRWPLPGVAGARSKAARRRVPAARRCAAGMTAALRLRSLTDGRRQTWPAPARPADFDGSGGDVGHALDRNRSVVGQA
jgi:hypothetical protein